MENKQSAFFVRTFRDYAMELLAEQGLTNKQMTFAQFAIMPYSSFRLPLDNS
jgi:hypothetical protein